MTHPMTHPNVGGGGGGGGPDADAGAPDGAVGVVLEAGPAVDLDDANSTNNTTTPMVR